MEKEIARMLFKLGCLKLSVSEPFTYASGLKGPIYCDNRLIVSDIPARQKVCTAFYDLLKAEFSTAKVIAGLATAGIPHGAWLAEKASLPMIYLRSKPKEHGKKNLLEGRCDRNDSMVLVEDLVNQGSSSKQVLDFLLENNYDVLGMMSIVDYQMPAAQKVFNELKVRLVSLTNLDAITTVGIEDGLISVKEAEEVAEWRKNPAQWKA